MAGNDQKPLSAEEQELDRKLTELDKKVTPSFIRKRLKLALLKKADAGDITAINDLKELEALESSPDAAPSASPARPAPSSAMEGAGASDDSGIPEKLLIRPRKYTMSEAAIKQRQTAANSPEKSKVMQGNANAWKTGEFAKSRITQIFRPCLSTCPNYPCELIDEGETGFLVPPHQPEIMAERILTLLNERFRTAGRLVLADAQLPGHRLEAAHLGEDAPNVEGGHGSVGLDEVGKPHAG